MATRRVPSGAVSRLSETAAPNHSLLRTGRFEYIWDWFENVRELYRKAALADRAVIVTINA